MATVSVGDIEQRRNRNGQAAVASVRLGWQVLPWMMMEGRKVPQIRAWQAGAAFRTEDDVRAWWGINFGHSPGIVCGAESRLWVLDIDPRNGGDLALADLVVRYGELPPDTFMVTTPGGGWHYYFEWTPECAGLRKHAAAPGLDVIAGGGWVAAPGSWSDAGRYDLIPGGSELRPAPLWLVSFALVGNPTQPEDGADWSGEDGNAGPDEWLNSEVVRIGATPVGGQRSALLAFTASLRRRGYARIIADQAAIDAMKLLATDPDKGPWTDVDVLAMVAGAWAKYRPADVGDELSAWAESPGLVQIAESAPSSAEVESQGPAVPLPPPSGAAVLGEPPQTVGPDDENGQEFRLFAAERLLSVNREWMIWDGRVWQRDANDKRHQIIREFGHELIRQAALAGVDGYTELMRRANRLGIVQGRDACLNYARDLFAVDVERLDAAVDWINTPDGMVNLETGDVRSARPADLVTRITAAGYDSAVGDPLWDRVLEQLIPSAVDREWLQRWCGYCLTGRTSEKVILAIHGPAGSGKSTVSEPFSRALGQYAQTWQPDVIVDRSSVNVDEAMYRVRGARLVTVSEMRRGTRLNEGVVKAATGGDTVAARGLYMSGIQYRPQFKLWVHTNFVPDSSDDALMRRFAFLRMGRELSRAEQDPRVKTILEEDVGSQRAILRWAVEGWQKVLSGVGVGRPERSDVEVEEHLLRSDPVRRFIEEVLVQVEGAWLETTTMFAAYESWCVTERIAKPMGPSKFAAGLGERGVMRERFLLTDGQRVTGYRGWSVTESGRSINV